MIWVKLFTLFVVIGMAFRYWMFSIPILIAWAAYQIFHPSAKRLRAERAEYARDIETSRNFSMSRLKREREEWRDSDSQTSPYSYQIGRHALETLAIRYGIPHQEKDEHGRIKDCDAILIRKREKLSESKYLCLLTQYRNREAIAVIETGQDYVKTFYPMTGQEWFSENSDWETTLKGNKGFTIKDMARMHIERVNSRPRNLSK